MGPCYPNLDVAYPSALPGAGMAWKSGLSALALREKRAGSKALLSVQSSGFAPAAAPGYVEHLPAGAMGCTPCRAPQEELLQRLVPGVSWTQASGWDACRGPWSGSQQA